jgi:TonB family protein
LSATRRFAARYPLAAPLDVAVLRFGVPHTIPGRSLDLSNKGMGMVLADELRLGELVGIEFRMEGNELPLRIRAVVRHEDSLRCGVEFLRQGDEEQEAIALWTLRMGDQKVHTSHAPLPGLEKVRPELSSPAETRTGALPAPHRRRFPWLAVAILVPLLLAGTILWWRWQQGWKEIESRVERPGSVAHTDPVSVPASVMENLVSYRVEPTYPDNAKEQNLRGTVVLDAVVGRDGTVVDLQPRSGPEPLVSAAMDSVRWWRYRPYEVNGAPATTATTIVVNFPGD